MLLYLIICFAYIKSISAHDVICDTSPFPPDAAFKVRESVFNLDLPPSQRWTSIVKGKSSEINILFKALQDLDRSIFNGYVFYLVDKYMMNYYQRMPYPFNEEIKGIANATGINAGQILLYNIFYEVFTVCTSILAIDSQINDPNATLYHARNMDFGLFLGWDKKNHGWKITEALKPLTISLDVQRGGKTVYKGITFAGYVGVLTAMKPGEFSLTINERFSFDGGFLGLMLWFMGGTNSSWISFLTRDLMENAKNFEDARQRLEKTSLIAPIYFILGGANASQGSIITRSRTTVLNERTFNTSDPGKWYLLETNYDWWKKPLPVDDRRTPAKKCLEEFRAQQNISFKTLYNILSTRPILNKLTVYTALMNVRDGEMVTYLRYCPDPCPPW